MRANEFIVERLTSIVYRYVKLSEALAVLQDKEFKLTSVVGNRVEEPINQGYKFYLSTTRSKAGSYHQSPQMGGVMFKLNGDFYNTKVKGVPLDYWSKSRSYSPKGPDRDEAEDRIMSNSPTLPIDGVLEMHMILPDTSKDPDNSFKQRVKEFVKLAKHLQIPTYLYTDLRSWVLQDKTKTISQKDHPIFTKGRIDIGNSRFGEYIEPALNGVVELITKSDEKQLTPPAAKFLYNVRYYNTSDSVSNALSNANRSDRAGYQYTVKIVNFMHKHGLKNTQDLDAYLKNKWKRK